MFKVTFNTTRRVFNDKHGQRIQETGRGTFSVGRYSVAKQIAASLQGISFDNPNDDLDCHVMAVVPTGRSQVAIDVNALDMIRHWLDRVEAEMTQPDHHTIDKMAAE